MAKFVLELRANEQKIVDSILVTWRKSSFQAMPYFLILTNQRLILEQKKNYASAGAAGGGLIGALVGSLIQSKMKTKVDEFELSEIMTVKHVKAGLSKQALEVTFTNGEVRTFIANRVFDILKTGLEQAGITVQPFVETA